MSGLNESSEFTGRQEGNVACASAADDASFLLVHDLIQNARRVFTEARGCRFNRHGTDVRTVQDSCTPTAPAGEEGI